MTSWTHTLCAWLTAVVFVCGTLSALERSSPPVPALAETAVRPEVPVDLREASGESLAVEPLETTTSSISATPTSSTTTTTRPRVSVPAPPLPRPRVVSAPAPPPPPPAPRVEASEAERCEAARRWAAERGLEVPAGWDYRCPDGARDEQGEGHWGIACWNCAGGSYVGINIRLIGSSDATLRYVVAHEICHALDYVTLGLSTELTADLCATLHGAGRP